MTLSRFQVLASLPLIGLTTIFWGPALFGGKTIIHGDSVILGLPTLWLQAHSFRHLGQLLWADGSYGGHPLFAEGQGAFASPFNMLLAWVIAPLAGLIPAFNIGRWLLTIIACSGVVGLCGSLGRSTTAAAFAAIAVILSPVWIGSEQNMTIYGALTWVPWSIWAMEEWLKRSSIRSALCWGAAVAMIILSGYPQAFHGAVIYMALSLLPTLLPGEVGKVWIAGWRSRVGTGLAAVAAAAGLSAIQWLPLLELTGHSHRSGGIGMIFQIPASSYLRGLLFSWARMDGADTALFTGAGSILVVALASLAFVVRTPTRAKGHMLATIILLQIGMGMASPLFRFLYNGNLLPGLHYFRTVHLYLNIAVIGLAVTAACVADGLRALPALDRGFLRDAKTADIARLSAGLVIILFWIAVAIGWWLPGIKWINFAIPAAAVAGGFALVAVRRSALLPLLLLGLLVAECLALRVHSYRFFDPALLAEPASAAAILASPGGGDKLIDISAAGSYGFIDSYNPSIELQAKRLLEVNCSMTNLMWGLRSLNAALALPMNRQVLAFNKITDEVTGGPAAPPGVRLADLLAVRFVSVDQPPNVSGLRVFWGNPAGWYIMENAAARPRFQLYGRHVSVASPEAALDTIEALRLPTLVIENPPEKPQAEQPDDPAVGDDPPGRFEVLKARSTEYRVDVTADHPAWFFVADANYPGWRATLDGRRVPLFTAQLLGKAVAIPPGRHRLEIAFVSSTFIVGLSISMLFLGAILLSPWLLRRSGLHSP